MATSAEVDAFLKMAKSLLVAGKYRILDQKSKYLSTLSQLGILKQDVLDDLMALSVHENWRKEKDNNPQFPGYIWKCKKQLHGTCIYIKLKLRWPSNDILLVMSYHIDNI